MDLLTHLPLPSDRPNLGLSTDQSLDMIAGFCREARKAAQIAKNKVIIHLLDSALAVYESVHSHRSPAQKEVK